MIHRSPLSVPADHSSSRGLFHIGRSISRGKIKGPALPRVGCVIEDLLLAHAWLVSLFAFERAVRATRNKSGIVPVFTGRI